MEWVLGKKINGEEAGGEKMQSYVVADTRARFCLRTMAKQTTNDRTGKTHFPKLNRFIFIIIILFCGPRRNMRASNKLVQLFVWS